MYRVLLLHLAILGISFYLLAIICDEFFVTALDKIAHRLKLSSEVAGATLMAVGSSAPEFFSSLFAVLKPGDHANVGAGTIVGSALFNILVIVGVSAMFKRAKLTWQPVIRDLIFYSFSIGLLIYSFADGVITMYEAILFVCLYAVYVYAVSQWATWFQYEVVEAVDLVENVKKRHPESAVKQHEGSHQHNDGSTSKLRGLFALLRMMRGDGVARLLARIIPDPEKRYVSSFFMSVLLIGVLSYALVESAIAGSYLLGIPDVIVALTVLAIGTSVPDLFSSVIVAKQGRGDMAIANAVGSNIFDILFGLGLPWVIVMLFKSPTVVVSSENLTASALLLFATVIAVLFILISRKWQIGKKSGLVLVGFYIAYLFYTVTQVV